MRRILLKFLVFILIIPICFSEEFPTLEEVAGFVKVIKDNYYEWITNEGIPRNLLDNYRDNLTLYIAQGEGFEIHLVNASSDHSKAIGLVWIKIDGSESYLIEHYEKSFTDYTPGFRVLGSNVIITNNMFINGYAKKKQLFAITLGPEQISDHNFATKTSYDLAMRDIKILKAIKPSKETLIEYVNKTEYVNQTINQTVEVPIPVIVQPKEETGFFAGWNTMDYMQAFFWIFIGLSTIFGVKYRKKLKLIKKLFIKDKNISEQTNP